MHSIANVPVQDKPLTSVADIGIETGSITAGETFQTVNAHKLHSFLQVGKKFSDWIKEQSEKYGFVEGKDFVAAQNLSIPNSGSAMARSQTVTDYFVSLDMAQSLTMVDANIDAMSATRH